MRSFSTQAVAGVILIMASMANAEGPGSGAAAPLVLKGTLEGGMMGIGGEHTGFVLKGVDVEVDLSAVENAADLEGEAVLVQGYFDMKQYVERGATLMFRATAAKAASDASPFPAPKPAAGGMDPAERARMKAEVLRLAQEDAGFRAELLQALQGGQRGQPVPR